MGREEAEAILGPDVCAALDERFGPPKPLTPAQITLLTALLALGESATDSDAA